jgi:hypothetical protein
MRRGVAWRPAQSTVAESRHDRGDVGHRAHDGDAVREHGLDALGREARRDRDDEPAPRHDGRDLREDALEDLRLDGEDDDVGALGRGAVVRDDADAELATQRGRPGGLRVGRDEPPATSPARGEDAAEQRAPHVSGAEDGDALVLHGWR